jgi:hypothetical protein
MAVSDIVQVPGAQFEETLAPASRDLLREGNFIGGSYTRSPHQASNMRGLGGVGNDQSRRVG